MSRNRNQTSRSEQGFVGWLENTRIELPLKGIECRFEVTGALAMVELDQVFHQNAAKPMDCEYTFPLPDGAAIYRCEMHLRDRVIHARTETRWDAMKKYAEGRAAGHRAALVELVRQNLFNLSIGNVQPDEVVVIRFAWFQQLDHHARELRLRIPTCPGIRYVPGKPLLRGNVGSGTGDDTDQVPDASRITPPRIDALHPDAAYFSVEGKIDGAPVEPGTVSSPTHPITVREKDGSLSVGLAGRRHLPDRDLVVTWRESEALTLASRAWEWRMGAERYVLMQLRAPSEVPVEAETARDFYFLVDRSSSMAGRNWQQTCLALRGFVKLLNEGDRVWITLFETYFQDYAEDPRPAAEVLEDPGFGELESLGVAGGTELLPAAEHVLQAIRRHSGDRPATVILITDGQIGNESEVLKAFNERTDVPVHTFGIDTAVNDAFLRDLARQQCGGCWLQTPDDDIASTVAELADRIRRPVLTDLSVCGTWILGGNRVPHIHAGEVVDVVLHGDDPSADSIEMVGSAADGSRLTFEVPLTGCDNDAIRLLWARERIACLQRSAMGDEAIALAKECNLICEGTAYVAVDEDEVVGVAEDRLLQPSMTAFSPLVQNAWRVPIQPIQNFLCATSGPARALRSAPDDPVLTDSAESFSYLLLVFAAAPQPIRDACAAWLTKDPGRKLERLRELKSLLDRITDSPAALPARETVIRFLRETVKVDPRLLENSDEWIDQFNQRAAIFVLLVQRKIEVAESSPPKAKVRGLWARLARAISGAGS